MHVWGLWGHLQYKIQSQHSFQTEARKGSEQEKPGRNKGPRRRKKSKDCLQPVQKDDQKGQMQGENYVASFEKPRKPLTILDLVELFSILFFIQSKYSLKFIFSQMIVIHERNSFSFHFFKRFFPAFCIFSLKILPMGVGIDF